MTTIERLRALLAEATPGPWGPAKCRDSSNPDNDPAWQGLYGFLGWEISPLEPPARGLITDGWDAALIAAAVNALPALLDVAEAARVITERPGVSDAGGDRWWEAHDALAAAVARLDAP